MAWKESDLFENVCGLALLILKVVSQPILGCSMVPWRPILQLL